jgi:NAD(P)H-hydrate repair Nnr-like enzyme with NAD(P)H-hydrate epimerase domain
VTGAFGSLARILCVRSQTTIARFGASLTLAGFVVAACVGCGGTVIDSAKTEDVLEQEVHRSTGKKVSSVECPSGVEVKAGATFECTVSFAGGKREVATLEIRNSDADVSVTGLRPEKGTTEQ